MVSSTRAAREASVTEQIEIVFVLEEPLAVAFPEVALPCGMKGRL